jgi:DNA-binding NtrC family response regulator
VAWGLPCHPHVLTSDVAANVPHIRPAPGFHGAVSEFKRHLIEATLNQMGGNRTRTARVLGLQRTYLLRLIRELNVTAPPVAPRRRSVAAG